MSKLTPAAKSSAVDQVDAERKHLDGLLKDRINFYLVFASVFLFGLAKIEFEEFRIYLLSAVTVVSLLISLAVLRTYRLVGKALAELGKDHPYVKYRKSIKFPPNANYLLVPIPFILTAFFAALTILCIYRCR